MATKLQMPVIISDNMVLQADVKARIWGLTAPGAKVTVKIAGTSASGRADRRGNFEVFIGPLACGGPYDLKVNTTVVRNVLVGDIWVCSGQSNMEWPVSQAVNGDEEARKARNNRVRIFSVPRMLATRPVDELPAGCRWQEVDPDSIKPFSAVGWFFGRELEQKLKIPIGLINTSWGGTRVEPWTSMEGLSAWRGFPAFVREFRKRKVNRTLQVTPPVFSEEVHLDTGNKGVAAGYNSVECKDRTWKKMNLPGYWTDKGFDFVGALWYRKEITVPEKWLGNDLYLSLGAFVDFDFTYFNGEQVGFTGKETPDFWSIPRKYVVPARLVRPGKNTIAVRVFAHKTVGGSIAAPDDLYMAVINKPALGRIGLAGSWKYILERKLKRLGVTGKVMLESTTPTLIYNAMLHPLVKFAIKGALWYQGESNAQEPDDYAHLFPAMITDWRKQWGLGDIPFYFVQLASYQGAAGSDHWPRLRDTQTGTLRLPNTGMAVAIDIGEPFDIHPRNKQDVGLRLALNALAGTYGRKVEYAGPTLSAVQLKGNKAVLAFDHSDGLKACGSKELKGFELAAAAGAFVPARAVIKGQTVEVSAAAVKKPQRVRYAWDKYPVCNLYNKAGLPAVPFQADVKKR